MGNKNKTFDDFNDDDKVNTSPFFDFDKAEEHTCIGKLVSIDEGNYGQEYGFLDVDDVAFKVGSYASLQGKIKEDDIGKKIKIVFTGEQKTKNGRMCKQFDVYKK